MCRSFIGGSVVLVIVAIGLPAQESLAPAGERVVKAADAPNENTLVGSGKHVTKDFKLADFTSVDVSGAFQVEVSQADSFGINVTADDNILEFVKAVKEGSTLRISIDARQKQVQATLLKAAIAMPTVEGVSLTGACQGTLKGFKSTKHFQAKLTGASTLEGKIEAAKVELDVMGASEVTLQGSGENATLSAGGASKLFLADFALDSTAVNLTGASTATVHVKGKLDYVLSGASQLEYRGNPTIGKSETSGVSSASSR